MVCYWLDPIVAMDGFFVVVARCVFLSVGDVSFLNLLEQTSPLRGNVVFSIPFLNLLEML